MEVLDQKRELIDWISNLDNELVLNDIYNLKKEKKIDFDKEFSNGLTSEEFRRRTTLSFKERASEALTTEEFKAEMKRRIRNYPVK